MLNTKAEEIFPILRQQWQQHFIAFMDNRQACLDQCVVTHLRQTMDLLGAVDGRFYVDLSWLTSMSGRDVGPH